MLKLKELEEIKELVKSNTIKKLKDLVILLDTEYTDKNPVQDAYTRMGRNESCISPTKIKDTAVAKSSEFEKKNMVKVWNGGASTEGELTAGKKGKKATEEE